jgi:hypothetical protein
MNCINLTLPFSSQAGLAALTALAILWCGVPANSCAMQHLQSQLLPEAEAVCDATIGSIIMAAQTLSAVYLADADLHICRGPRTGLALAIFFTLYLGVAVPLTVSSHYEARLKREYVRMMTHGHAARRGGGSWALVRLLAALCAWMPLCCPAAELLMGAGLFDVRRCSWHGGT